MTAKPRYLIAIFLKIALLLGATDCEAATQTGAAIGERAKRVFAHLMPQRLGDYGGKISHLKPLIGEQDPHDPAYLEYEILLAKAARLDGFIINPTFFKAGQTKQNLIMLALIDVICAMNEKWPALEFRYIFSYDDNQRDAAEVTKELVNENYAWLRDNVIEHPVRRRSCFRDDLTGRAVMMVWSAHGRRFHWEAVGEHFGHDAVLLCTRSAKKDDPYSDGNFSWIFSDHSMLERVPDNWGKEAMKRFFDAMYERKPGRILVGSVYPGFDDRFAGWGGGWRYIRRHVKDGEVMALTWGRIIAASDRLNIPWVQIVTWNDWPEGTSVEPATLPPDRIEAEPHFGYQALKTCQRKIIEFKAIRDIPANDEFGIRIPYEIHQLRKRQKHSQADRVLHLFMNERYKAAMRTAKTMSARNPRN